MADSTWNVGAVPGVGNYHDPASWLTNAVPDGVATFAYSVKTVVEVQGSTGIGAWNITGASGYAFNVRNTGGLDALVFTGAGITGTQTSGYIILQNFGTTRFTGSSSAGVAIITNEQRLIFGDTSTAGSATIENNSTLTFSDTSSAGTAQIVNKGDLLFSDKSDASQARIVNASANAHVLFDDAAFGNRKFSVGSIEGGGRVSIAFGELTVGLLGGTQTLSAEIRGFQGSLVKAGTGTLVLTGTATYDGPTTVASGTLMMLGAAATTQSSVFTVERGATLSGKVVFGGAGPDVATNRGTLLGSVDMGAGNDTFNGALGGAAKVFGGIGNDTLIGGAKNDVFDGGTGVDTLSGGAGADKLTGGIGKDRLTGGANADDFIFTSIVDSRGSARDTIVDFNRAQGDDIWLRAIDANTKVAGNQAFKFIGKDAFSRTAGELRYQKVGNDTHILGDVNGDGRADLVIVSDKVINFVKGDFIL